MAEQKPIGIYLCKSTNGHADVLDITEVSAYARKIPEVAVVWDTTDINLADVSMAASKIREKNLKRIVIAGDTPGYFKSFFALAMVAAGNNPTDVMLASFKEHGATCFADTDRAKAILYCAVNDIPFETASLPDDTEVHPDTLVIGGGIAGIQAALEIADANEKVYLVEKSPTIGGHMAMFDKTFPTLDCAACILTPKMVEVNQHPKIELITYAEVTGITGDPGNYRVRILKKARHVNLATCIGCGTCAEKCPSTAVSEFDAGTTMRSAIYIPFPQAVPNKYVIDEEACRFFTKGKCGVCVKFCPVDNCINLDEKDQEIEIKVGNVIVATGFKTFDAKKTEQFGYGKYPNVVTSIELERLVNAAGPTGGFIKLRTQDKKGNWIFQAGTEEPKSVALIHCVGSRDENHNKYCSRVCCMYSLKLAHLIKEKLPQADVFEYFIDMRAFGKGYEEFYERIKEERVHIIRGRTAKVDDADGQLLLRTEDIQNDKILEQKVDMVVLAVGLEPSEDSERLSEMLSIKRDAGGWFVEADYNTDPVGTYAGGITIAGVCQGPKDIPDSVAQGSAAASKVLQSIVKGSLKKGVNDVTLNTIELKVTELSTIEEGK